MKAIQHLQDLPVLVLGLGASGLAMARWCARHGAQVTVADTRDAPAALPTLQAEWPDVRFVSGAFDAALVEGQPIRAVYRSPGLIPAEVAPVVDAARAIGLPVGGELDLFVQALAQLRNGDATDEADEASETSDSVAAVDAPDIEADAAIGDTDEVSALEDADAGDTAEESMEDDDDTDRADPPLTIPELRRDKGYRPAVLAVTGTNGKTTVTALARLLVERAGKRVEMAGNIGPTLLDTLTRCIDAGDLPEVWVLELSSFQLDGVQGFDPVAATVLNLSQDHLDWHGDMAAYSAAKARVFGRGGRMLLNRDDAAVMAMLAPADRTAPNAKGRAKAKSQPLRVHTTFGADLPTRPGDYGIESTHGVAWLVRAMDADETIKPRRGVSPLEVEIHLQRLLPVDALRIRGRHNALNALAALALASAAGCALAPMLYGLRDYRGEPHRVESVGVIGGVEYFNDSKGTNVGATVAALAGLGAERKVVVILGGDGKGQDFSPLADPVTRFVRKVVLIGRDAPLIEAELAATSVACVAASSMQEAVASAARLAKHGDAVLLSPACASFDMFRNYGHRGEVFRDAVAALAAEIGNSLEVST